MFRLSKFLCTAVLLTSKMEFSAAFFCGSISTDEVSKQRGGHLSQPIRNVLAWQLSGTSTTDVPVGGSGEYEYVRSSHGLGVAILYCVPYGGGAVPPRPTYRYPEEDRL